MTLKELINSVLDTGRVELMVSELYNTYYTNREESVTYIDILTVYISVIRGLLELTPDNKICDEFAIYLYSTAEGEMGAKDTCVSLYNKSEKSRYALDCTPWRELVNMEVIDDAELDEHCLLAHLLWEITFYGFSSSDVDRSTEELAELSERIKSGEEELYEFDIDDLDEDDD